MLTIRVIRKGEFEYFIYIKNSILDHEILLAKMSCSSLDMVEAKIRYYCEFFNCQLKGPE